jgi:hypothetical protein
LKLNLVFPNVSLREYLARSLGLQLDENPPTPEATMNNSLEEIQDTLRALKLDDSLLALNHFLAVSNRITSDPSLELKINGLKFRPPAYIVHFLAKQLLLHASNLGTRTLEWDQFLRLIDLCISLDDPIQHDPDWKSADPTGFFERIMAQQFPAQAIKPVQRYGLSAKPTR